MPPARDAPARREEPQQPEEDYRATRHSPASQERLRGVGGHQVRSPDWRDFVIRSGRETWVPRPIQPFGTTVFRPIEHGGPEIGE